MCESIRYCTFWYPTIFHQELKPLPRSEGKNIYRCEISDESKALYKLNIELDEKENLIIESNFGNKIGNKSFIVHLNRTKHHRNGFVQYSFNKLEIPDEWLRAFKIVLVKDVYHLAKKFYHQHEVDSDKDAALRGVISKTEGGIDDDDNRFLIRFLKDFAPVFEKYAKNISASNSKIQNLESKLKSLPPEKREEIKKYQDAILSFSSVINRLCENACIEYTYCKTLLSSIHNKSFIHNLQVDENEKGTYCDCDEMFEVTPEEKAKWEVDIKEEKKKWRRLALNIRNSMRYIENIKYKNQNRLNDLTMGLVGDVGRIINVAKENTDYIKQAVDQGKRSERRNIILASFSIFISFAFGFPIDQCVKAGWNAKFIFYCSCATISVIFFLLLVFGGSIHLKRKKK